MTDNLDGLHYREVIAPDALDEFERLQDIVWQNLVEIHTNLEILRQSLAYDRALLVSIRSFLRFSQQQLFRSCILGIHRTFTDEGADVENLRKMKTFLVRNVAPEFKDALRVRLREAKPSPDERDVFDRISAARDTRIAHNLLIEDETQIVAGITLADLECASASLVRQFHALTIGQGGVFVIGAVAGSARGEGEWGYILDLIVAHSNPSASFDKHSEWWERSQRQRLSRTAVEQINDARRRFGMPPIPLPE